MDRRTLLGGTAALAAAGLAARGGAATTPRKPNFIIIYCDDLGYGDIGPTGGRTIKTPHLDAMTREGLTLTDYYAPANVCTPSRAGLLTGRYPIRTKMAAKVLLGPDTTGMPLSETTIAEALKPAGYASALVGKWHLGHVAPYWPPTRQGFDYFYGIPYSHDIEPLKVYEAKGDALSEAEPDYVGLQNAFYTRAEAFIEDNRSRPFFLELALSAPHLPNYPPAEFAGKSAAGAYGDAVAEVDAITGRLLAKLKALGLDRDTMVIFTSDNGPWFEGSAGGLRQRKGGGAYDGGYRVPFVARWPGRIHPGTRSDAIAMGIDLMPTLCALAGAAVPPEIDGKDISAVLLRGGASPHDELVLFDGETVVGLRSQRWKYTLGDWYRGNIVPFAGRGYPQLYDMRDRSEDYSVASLHPDIVKAMDARLKRAAAIFEPLRTVPKSGMAPLKQDKHVPDMWRD